MYWVMWDLLTDLSLWVTLFSLEHHVVVRTESPQSALALERRQISTVLTLGTTGPLEFEPNPKPNTRTKLGTNLPELTDVSATGFPASDTVFCWVRRERRACVDVNPLETAHRTLTCKPSQ